LLFELQVGKKAFDKGKDLKHGIKTVCWILLMLCFAKKTLLSVPRSRVDLLPYYARLIATLSPYYPDISDAILVTVSAEPTL
jgi:hypothetical protein